MCPESTLFLGEQHLNVCSQATLSVTSFYHLDKAAAPSRHSGSFQKSLQPELQRPEIFMGMEDLILGAHSQAASWWWLLAAGLDFLHDGLLWEQLECPHNMENLISHGASNHEIISMTFSHLVPVVSHRHFQFLCEVTPFSKVEISEVNSRTEDHGDPHCRLVFSESRPWRYSKEYSCNKHSYIYYLKDFSKIISAFYLLRNWKKSKLQGQRDDWVDKVHCTKGWQLEFHVNAR